MRKLTMTSHRFLRLPAQDVRLVFQVGMSAGVAITVNPTLAKGGFVVLAGALLTVGLSLTGRSHAARLMLTFLLVGLAVLLLVVAPVANPGLNVVVIFLACQQTLVNLSAWTRRTCLLTILITCLLRLPDNASLMPALVIMFMPLFHSIDDQAAQPSPPVEIRRGPSPQMVRDGLLTAIEHELRTNLTAIIGYLQLFELSNNPTPGSYLERTIKRVRSATNRIGTNLSTVIEASGLSNGSIGTNFQPTDVLAILNEESKAFDALLYDRQRPTLIECPSDFPGRIDADGPKLKLAFANLLDHAWRRAPSGGITVSMANDDERWRCTLNYPGEPINESDLNHLFDSYFQSPDEMDALPRPSHGLGLPLTHQIVSALKGTIRVESSLEMGTSILLEFPLTISPPQPVGDVTP